MNDDTAINDALDSLPAIYEFSQRTCAESLLDAREMYRGDQRDSRFLEYRAVFFLLSARLKSALFRGAFSRELRKGANPKWPNARISPRFENASKTLTLREKEFCSRESNRSRFVFSESSEKNVSLKNAESFRKCER